MIHYISYFDPPWHNEQNVAAAMALHGYPPTCYHFPDPLDRPSLGGKPSIRPGDLVFTSVPQRFPVRELQTYKDQGAGLACWYFDWVWRLGNREAAYLPRLLLMDAVFSTDGFSSHAHTRRGVKCRRYLPQGAVPMDSLPPPPPGTAKHDIVFLGHLRSRDRKHLARRLSARWNFANRGSGRRVWGRALSDLCQSTAIMIGTNFRNIIPGYWSDRCYVVMGAGGFYLGQYVSGLDQTFTARVHCGFFDGPSDMERQVEWWLDHPAEREACRLRGHALVQEHHTYTQRVAELLTALRSLKLLE